MRAQIRESGVALLRRSLAAEGNPLDNFMAASGETSREDAQIQFLALLLLAGVSPDLVRQCKEEWP